MTNDDLQARILMGWGRDQPIRIGKRKRRNKAYRHHNGTSIPSFRKDDFMRMPAQLRLKFYKLLSLVAKEIRAEKPNAFGDKMREKIFFEKMKAELGIPDGEEHAFPWEYVDIVVTCETGLCRHADHSNDGRDGYRHCAIYSFFRSVNNVEYKVSKIYVDEKKCWWGNGTNKRCNGRNHK